MRQSKETAAENPGKQHQLWTITVVGGEGDEAKVGLNEHVHLEELLHKGVNALYGETADPKEYDLVIRGVTQTDLQPTLVAAGLENHDEVTILKKDVSRG